MRSSAPFFALFTSGESVVSILMFSISSFAKASEAAAAAVRIPGGDPNALRSLLFGSFCFLTFGFFNFSSPAICIEGAVLLLEEELDEELLR